MFKIITKTDDFIVVSKNADINFHDEGNYGNGLFSSVKKYCLAQLNINELFPVHRLDKMTSGLLIFATNSYSAKIFGELFSQHKIEKYYLAISENKPSKKQGLIKGDMAKSRRGMYKLLRSMENPAITQFFSFSIGNKQRLYLLKPHSGKTHQLRVALSSIGVPILGDPLYTSKSTIKSPCAIDRGYLHAFVLKFEFLGEIYQCISPPSEGELFLSDHIQEQIKKLNKPWLLDWPKV